MQVDFYTLLEEAEDKAADLQPNLLKLLDRLLQEGDLPGPVAAKIASLRAKVAVDLRL